MEMTAFNILSAGLIGTLFGVVFAFFGYRLFLVLLPIWGFFFGLLLGANTVQWLFNSSGFLVNVTGWVVGLVVGAIFAVLSCLFYIASVAIIAGSLDYFVAVCGLLWIGVKAGFLLWLIGIVVGVVVIFVTLQFNLQKWVIITTAIMGAAVSFGTILQILYPASNLLDNPVKFFLDKSPFLLILFALMAAAGIVVRYLQNKSFTLDSYNRMETE